MFIQSVELVRQLTVSVLSAMVELEVTALIGDIEPLQVGDAAQCHLHQVLRLSLRAADAMASGGRNIHATLRSSVQ